MIHELRTEIAARLALQKCPVPIIDGPERTKTTTGARERIVIEHDDDAGDTVSSTRSQHRNPKVRMIRNIGAKITIYAQATNAGAADWEHKRRADHIADLVLVALNYVLKVRRNEYTITKSGFIPVEDLAASEVIAGARYQIKFTFERAVNEQTWAGDARPEGSPATIGSVTKVLLAHGPSGAAPETGCGG